MMAGDVFFAWHAHLSYTREAARLVGSHGQADGAHVLGRDGGGVGLHGVVDEGRLDAPWLHARDRHAEPR